MLKINMRLINLLIIFIIMMISIVFTAKANAVYTGTYMFTEDGNDNDVDSVEDHINKWFSDNSILYKSDLELIGKLEENEAGQNDDFSFVWSNSDHKSGIWSSNEPVRFYSVKGGTQYAMYWVDPALETGIFSTENLLNKGGNIPALSHISFWTNNNTYDTTPTPEPGTIILLGLGLLGLTYTQRKK